jgi:hypothetical protein
MRSVLRTLGWAVLLNCTQLAFTSDSLLPHPVATLDTSELLPVRETLRSPIKVENTLSVYRLPPVCGGPRVTRRADQADQLA